MHKIDNEMYNHNSLSPGDVNGDGDLDIINSNSDWNTRAAEKHVVWHENPGIASPDQTKEWPQHMI